MKIERIELFHVAMPLIYPWRTAYGEDSAIHSILCRISSGSVDGWGESTPFAAPCYSPECAAGVFTVVRDWLAPAIIGQQIESGAELQSRLSMLKGNPFAKAVLDTAWWALSSNLSGTPLHLALGATRAEVPVGADFGVMDNFDELLEAVGQAVADGFPRVKLKFRPGWDTPMVAAVRRQFPDQTLHVDCNSGYRLGDLDQFRRLDNLNLAMIEQPLQHDDLLDHSMLQASISTPICLDESITSLRKAKHAVALKSCRFVNIKPGRVGGLTPAVAIHNLCSRANTPCWVGGMLESAVGAAHSIALAMLDNFTYPADIFPSSRFYHEDLSNPPIELVRSDSATPMVRARMQLPEPVPDRLEKATLQRAAITG